ncbi:MAG: T9SS type A sorting domain-containing protein [bacterium]
MKKLIVLLFTIFMTLSIKTNAQIPNNGFEIWENYPDPENQNNVYQKPDQWVGFLPTNPATYSFSIEKNMESYPVGTGQYSMLIKPDIANEVNGAAFSWDSLPTGISWENILPAFPISYRPYSLSLYYKYLPDNGDSMRVACNLYKNGIVIGGFDFNSPQTVSNWSLLEIPINFYTSDLPDSATIILTTFCTTQHTGSRLYVDNLSFNSSNTSIGQGISSDLPSCFALMQNYPNPFNSTTTIKYSIYKTNIVTLTLYSISGKEITTLLNDKRTPGNYTIELNTNNLPSGVYYYQILSGSFKDTKKLILLK